MTHRTETQPLWMPSSQNCPMQSFLEWVNRETGHTFKNYWDLYRWSIHDRSDFWGRAAKFLDVVWQQAPTQIFIDPPVGKMRGGQWFPGAKLNYAENLLKIRDHQVRLTGIAEGCESPRTFTGYQLYNDVAQCAAGLRMVGVGRGDRVCGVVSNVPEAVIAMLATASLGAIWASCSPDFGAPGIVDRFGQIEPKVLFYTKSYRYNGKSIDCLPTIQEALDQLPTVRKAVCINHLNPGSSHGDGMGQSWNTFLTEAPLKADPQGHFPLVFEPVPFEHPLFIMFSSGTTGVPKCIVHSVGGTLLQHKKELILHTGLTKGKKLLYFTTCGWMMWNWMVSTLATEADLVLFEGSPGYPDMEVLWQIVQQQNITALGISPKYIASCITAGIHPKKLGLERLDTILSTGSPLLPEHFEWVYQKVGAGIHLASISGGTDIISCFMLGNPLLPVYAGEIQAPGLGMAVEAWADEGQAVVGQKAELVCTKPFVSMPVGFWNDPNGQKYSAAYFEFYPHQEVWRHGDFIEVTKNGGIIVYGRSDATLNPGGVRIGTAEIYRQVETIPGIVDSLAVGHENKGDVDIVLFVKLQDRGLWTDALKDLVKARIRQNLTPRHVPKWIFPVSDIPYTRSGKKLELAAGQAMEGKTIQNMTAITNPESLDDFYRIGREIRGS